MIETRLKETIRDVVDFPKKGIVFKDITPILQDAKLCADIVNEIIELHKKDNIQAVAGIESRGFFFGMMVANAMKVPFIPIRKKGKLPYKTVSYKYDLEYGSAEIEMHEDAVLPNTNVLIHDDLLATGGTAQAAAELILKQKGKVKGFNFIVELDFLKAREILNTYSENISNLVRF